jgi:hypothetical protein
MMEKINWTRINNDTYGNPRYVCHFTNFSKLDDYNDADPDISLMYQKALNRAKELGGKKFHNKQYGGGIVFQCYSIPDLEKRIAELMKEDLDA